MRWLSAHLGMGVELPPELNEMLFLDSLARRYHITPAQAEKLSRREIQAAHVGSMYEKMLMDMNRGN